jgi:folate-dependent tRNA-U54 methylase TrmFO/GidA
VAALAVDREKFAKLVTKNIQENKYIEVIRKEVDKIDENEINIICNRAFNISKNV